MSANSASVATLFQLSACLPNHRLEVRVVVLGCGFCIDAGLQNSESGSTLPLSASSLASSFRHNPPVRGRGRAMLSLEKVACSVAEIHGGLIRGGFGLGVCFDARRLHSSGVAVGVILNLQMFFFMT